MCPKTYIKRHNIVKYHKHTPNQRDVRNFSRCSHYTIKFVMSDTEEVLPIVEVLLVLREPCKVFPFSILRAWLAYITSQFQFWHAVKLLYAKRGRFSLKNKNNLRPNHTYGYFHLIRANRCDLCYPNWDIDMTWDMRLTRFAGLTGSKIQSVLKRKRVDCANRTQ